MGLRPVARRLRVGPLRRRVPVMLQLNNVECGAACLAMVLSYHRRRTSVTQCREQCAGGRGGVSAARILRAARSHGLAGRGLRPTPEILRQIPLPAIVHWNRDHFVVLERLGTRRVDIVDPAWGRRRLTVDEFDEGVSDAVLVLQPGPDFAEARRTEPSTLRTLGSIFTRLPGIRSTIAQILLATVLLQILGLAMPVATTLIVDELFRQVRPNVILLLGLGLLITLVAQIITNYLRSVLLLYLQGRLDWQVLVVFAKHLFRLPLRYYHQRSTGDIMTRLGSIGALRDILTNQSVSSILDAALVLTYVALMFYFDAFVALVVVAVIVVQVITFVATGNRARDLTARGVAAFTNLNEYIMQVIAGVATVKATGAEDRVAGATSDRIYRWTMTTLMYGHLTAVLETIANALRSMTPVLVLWLGTIRVLHGHMSPGSLLGITWLSAAILTPLTAVLTNVQRLQAAAVQTERLGDVLRAEPERSGPAAPPPRHPDGGRIELRNVSFRYDDDGPPTLRDISAVIERGQRVALVGRSGAGKTTLAWLLLGLYDPSDGEILYDGVPLSDLTPRELRHRFGVVLQDSFTLRGTIRDNIAFARPNAPFEDVVRAARVADVHAEVSRLPLGYNTPLSERGMGLSGGQLQRLALARALVTNPSVLVLDEATSHLDAETERRIVSNLRGVGCTQVVIAHRLSTVRDVDLILVLRDGQLVESGDHASLLARGGDYAGLVAAQMGTDRPGPVVDIRKAGANGVPIAQIPVEGR